MQFLQPLMFLALAAIPLILLLHALKPKPKQIEVTNLFLWEQLFKERSRNVRLRRLRRNLPLLFQVALVMLAALALAQPVRVYFTAKHGNLIFVIDTSASMQTRQAAGTRFDQAKTKALKLLAQASPMQNILVIEAGREPKLRAGFSYDRTQAQRLIEALQPTDAPGDLSKAVYLALSFVDPQQDDTIYLLTDGAGMDFAALAGMHPSIRPVVISGGDRNIGITKFCFREVYDQPAAYQIMLEITNFTPSPRDCPFELSVDGSALVAETLTLQARETRLLIFSYQGLLTGIAKAELTIDDDFEVDNVAYLTLSAAQDLWILLASPGNYFSEQLLQAYPNVLLNKVTEISQSSWATQLRQHDLIIADRVPVPITDAGNLLLIDAYSPSLPISKTGEIASPEINDWDRRHPLLASVNLGGLKIENAAILNAAPDLPPLIETAQTGLMFAYEHDQLRAVLLGFDLTRSDLPLKVAFPVLISNIINWLNPHQLAFSALAANAGEPYSIALQRDTADFSIRNPQGIWTKYQATGTPFVFTETQRVGVYTILENEKTRYFTVNLTNAAESDITPPTLTALSAGSTLDLETIEMQRPLWMLLLLAGVIVLMVEWQVWLKTG